jgi:hypothetical protein
MIMRLAIGLMLLLAVWQSAAHALTPSQSADALAKTRAQAAERLKAQAAIKERNDALAKARADVLTRAKVRIISAASIRAETNRRIDAAEKAAKANAQITSFRAGPPTSHPVVHKDNLEIAGHSNVDVGHTGVLAEHSSGAHTQGGHGSHSGSVSAGHASSR